MSSTKASFSGPAAPAAQRSFFPFYISQQSNMFMLYGVLFCVALPHIFGFFGYTYTWTYPFIRELPNGSNPMNLISVLPLVVVLYQISKADPKPKPKPKPGASAGATKAAPATAAAAAPKKAGKKVKN